MKGAASSAALVASARRCGRWWRHVFAADPGGGVGRRRGSAQHTVIFG